ncbi:shufflon system plasmid conjugative transfer pilus tip adhesin PilV, partial [Chromobacterium haemolyticum]|uniref:shufflon system plasmid conjugative transfer pilus tip adhesin PilV n=1 Tax=Chromobacterium haemolyticum TaxID=394935 RepID=UPI0024491F1D
MKSLTRQRGFTALESLVVMMVAIVALGFGGQYLRNYADNMANQSAADHQKLVTDAAVKYIKDNYSAILATATATTPATITTAMLKSTGYLQNQVADTNPFGQSYQFLALEPTANSLQTLMVTTGGETIPDMGIRRIAQLVGAQGGFISAADTTKAQGSFGGWSMTLSTYGTSPGAGHLASALFFADGALVSDYVYRNAVSGHPELNTMNTPLIMSSSTIVTSGSACTTNGAIARDTNGVLMSCQSGYWKSQGSQYWKDPVANYASLPASGNNQGDVRETLDTARAFTWTGAAWSALAVDQNGNLTVPGTVTANKVVTAAGNGVQVGSSFLYGDSTNTAIRQSGALYVQNADGSAAADINVSHANISAVATVGAACSPNGSIAQDGTGLLLSCQSG